MSTYSSYSSASMDCSSPTGSEGVEEYEPEHPEILEKTIEKVREKVKSIHGDMGMSSVASFPSGSLQKQLVSCDEDGFYEVWLSVSVNCYPSTLGRMMEVAGFGVWISDENNSNFSGVLDSSRPQNQKAVMIHASARAIEAMKRAGYSRIRINLETEYLNKNVADWILKYMKNPGAESSNWDEFKYHSEILDLCSCATGMIIKFSHCSADNPNRMMGLAKANVLAKKATDSWVKRVHFVQNNVGMPPSF